MCKKKVAVVIPCFNCGRLIIETISSVKNQTCKASEIIIVDDGSNDPESMKVLESLEADAELRVLKKNNGGLASARNWGISNAISDFILPLDADDVLAPSFIESCFAAFDAYPTVSIVATKVKMFGTKSASLRLPKITKKNMLVMNCLVATAMFKKEVWNLSNGYNENMVYGYEDWDFWLSCIELDLKFYRVPKELFLYRIREKSMVSELLEDKSRKKQMKQQLKLNHKNLFASEKINLFRTMYLKLFYLHALQDVGRLFVSIFSANSGSKRFQA